jgi:predicted amidophosphoribosyltransferase
MPNICLAMALYTYTPVIKTVVHGIKFKSNMALGRLMQARIHPTAVPMIFFETDGFVCVPSHWFRQLFRGRPHIPLVFHNMLSHGALLNGMLRRQKYTRGSAGLTRRQRVLRSRSPRFEWRGGANIQSVTLVDDVCTTGATLSEVAKCLKESGVHTIMALVLAHQPIGTGTKHSHV